MTSDTMEAEVPAEVAVDRAEDVSQEHSARTTEDEVSPASKQKRKETAHRAEEAMRKLMEGGCARDVYPDAVPASLFIL